MLIDIEVHYHQERNNLNDDNNGLLFGIYTYDIPKEDIGTDNMFNNSIVNVQWFKTKKKQKH